MFLKFSQVPKENTCVGDTFLKGYNPEDSTQALSCEICKIFKDTNFYRTVPVVTSDF